MTLKPYKTIGRETVFKHKFFELVKDGIEMASGYKGEYYYRTSEDGVHAIRVDEKQENLILVKQYRYPVDDIVIECTGGLIEDKESPLEAANREFEEETGYHGDTAIPVGKMAIDATKADFYIHEFIILNAKKIAEPKDTVTEETEVFILPVKETWEFMKSNKISSPQSISTIVKALLYLNVKPV